MELVDHTQTLRHRVARRHLLPRPGLLRHRHPEPRLDPRRLPPGHEGDRLGLRPARPAGAAAEPHPPLASTRWSASASLLAAARRLAGLVLVVPPPVPATRWFLIPAALSGLGRRASRWSAAGSSPRSAGSRGPCTATCCTKDAVTTAAGVPVTLGRRHRALPGAHRGHDRRAVADEPAMAQGGARAPRTSSRRRTARGPSRCRSAVDDAVAGDAGRRLRGLLATMAAYALFAGADFGGGIWDLLAGGPQRGSGRGRRSTRR